MRSNRTWVLEDSPHYQPLRDAALSGDYYQLESLLTPEIDINAMYGNGSTGRSLLHFGAMLKPYGFCLIAESTLIF
jgi:hypothetical protein